MSRLQSFFRPDSVAVIGATDREGAVGRAILENLLDEFDGDIVPINPNRREVLGHECYTTVESAPSFDLAIVVTPATAVVDTLRRIGESGCDAVVVISAGFSEAGSDGMDRERQLREVASTYDLDVIGPNCLGIMSTHAGLNASFGPDTALEGSIALLSQSGAFITAVIDWANEQGIGFRDVVSLGNKAVLDETDLLEAWREDPETTVVIGYLEGIDDGRAFIETAREVTSETPIVLVKSGRTEAGAQAASSHTGAIAGSDRAYQAGLDQAGVLRAETVVELADYARCLSGLPIPETDGVAIVTNAGGPGVLTADAVGESSLSIASFSDDTIEELSSILPAEVTTYNPIDVIGDADAERFASALNVALSDPGVGSAIVVSAPTAVLDYDRLADIVIEARDTHDIPIVTSVMGGKRVRSAETDLRTAGIPNFFDPARAVAGLDSLVQYREIQSRTYEDPATFAVDRDRVREILNEAVGRGTSRLGVESMDILDAYGIETPVGRVVDDPDEARDIASSIDGDVVLKIVSPDISHKSDIGGVRIGVADEDVADAFEDIVSRARSYQPDATILGVQVQELIDLDRSTETIVGMNRDPQFGPLLLFGLGGIFVEVLQDTAVRVAPVSERESRAMIDEIRAAPLLRGARGRPPADIDGVVETIQRLSQLVTDFPAILELDVNPLVVGPDGVTAIDLRLTLETESL